ncbi:hypothetical protein [Mycobacterium sp. UM_Kg1]|uniref:hypothetical protein n=1 Tax=Mycobacterium sp. UM_Kg1 TaxID=1545691 RepID=UPI00061AD4AC|nr:hypothetical protein [Mycobacterium sp. UM_Kg1]
MSSAEQPAEAPQRSDRADGRRWRWPSHLFGGRVRTSTLVLVVAFVAVWWLYDSYREEPAPPPAPQVVPPGFIPDPAYTWVPRTRLQQPPVTITKTVTPPPTTTEAPVPAEPPPPEPPAPTPVPGFPFCPPLCPPAPVAPEPTEPGPPVPPPTAPPVAPENPAPPGPAIPASPPGPVAPQG